MRLCVYAATPVRTNRAAALPDALPPLCLVAPPFPSAPTPPHPLTRPPPPRGHAEIKGKDGEGEVRGRAAMVEHVDPRLTVDQAIKQLRNAITQRIKSCNQGELIRCWIEFRTKTGASKEGVTLVEFRRGLRTYGIPLSYERAGQMYLRFDENNDGQIQMKEFIDIVIGRDNGSYQTNYKFRKGLLDDTAEEGLMSPASKKKEKKKRLSKELAPPTWKPLAAEADALLARAQAEVDAKKRALPVPAPNPMIDMTNAWVDPASARANAADVRAEAAADRPMTGVRRPASRQVPTAVDSAAASTPMGEKPAAMRPFSAAAKVEQGPATQTPPESVRPSTALQRKPPLPLTNPALVLANSGRGVKPPRKSTGRRKPPRSLTQTNKLNSLRRGAKQDQLVPLAVRQFLATSPEKGPDGETSLLPMRTLQHHGACPAPRLPAPRLARAGSCASVLDCPAFAFWPHPSHYHASLVPRTSGSRLLALPTQSIPPSPIKGVRS